MKTTKKLLSELGEKSVFWLVWAIIWRFYTVVIGVALLGMLLA